ncbi:hypothetical protein MTR67_039150 [Solanum verrucosum]|uniref:Reverse transcriptase/retrotransposon-derived protein RNase H-like domain-containing protein n=1 Tax=Solanum verrucosum TaxID=315347 RepID=A0AAF0UHB7_SOLVR|nr:hypothetical protein MTR67_039150 [Solanum verrucosum]
MTMTQNEIKFLWSETCEKSFKELMDRLTSVPVFTLQEGSDGFVVYSDSSRIGLACVFMQHGKFIAYFSRQLKVHKKNYSSKYVFTQKDLNLRQIRRWLELLKDFCISVLYHPRKGNVVADSFGRLSMGSIARVEDDMKEFVRDAHKLTRLGVRLVDSNIPYIKEKHKNILSFFLVFFPLSVY